MGKDLLDFFEQEFSDIIKRLTNNLENRLSVPSFDTIIEYFNKKLSLNKKLDKNNILLKINLNFYIKALKSDDENIKLYSLFLLGKMKAFSAVDEIINFLSDSNENIVAYAARALGNIGDSTAMPHLMSLLSSDANEIVIKEVILALGEIGDPIAVLSLTSMAKNKKYKYVTIEALGNIADPMSIDLLINLLNDEDGFIRAKVAYAMRNFKTSLAINPLIAALDDNYPDVANMAAFSLGKIKTPKAVRPLVHAYIAEKISLDALLSSIYQIGKKSVNDLMELLSSDNYDVKLIAIKLLGEIGDNTCIEALIKIFNKEFVEESVLDENTFFDVFIIEELLGSFNKLKDIRTLPYVIKASNSSYISVKKSAEISLHSIIGGLKKEDYKILLELEKRVDNKEFDMVVIKFIEENVVREGIEFLFSFLTENSDAKLKRKAAIVLGKFGDKRALGTLSDMMNDSDIKYAKIAKTLIKKLSPNQ